MRAPIIFRGSGQDSILRYYKETFNPIEKKYNVDAIIRGIQAKAPAHIRIFEHQLDTSIHESELRAQLQDALIQHESSRNLSDLTKKDYTHILENFYSIYGSSAEEIENQVQLIDITSHRVIGEYLRIDGLERLFCEQYIDFEWEMHLRMNHHTSQMDFYRDHFIHQIRDAYTMDRLLQNSTLYEKILSILQDSSRSKVSHYFCNMVQRQKELFSHMPEYQFLLYDETFIERNIIYHSCYMAGLFHDIGYPETYLRTLRDRISDYMPNMHPSQPQELPPGIFSKLQNSLLFRVVPYDEIKKRIEKTEIDHGTLSALAFLLHFYENGAIFQMSPYKAASVELAALAIYNHTYHYGLLNSGKESDDFRPIFQSNPIAFFLRICDDLQEWDRVYFELSNRSNVLICSKCKTPIIGQYKVKDANMRPIRTAEDELLENTIPAYQRHYICNCCKPGDAKSEVFCRLFDGDDSFPYRRMYNVNICESLEVCDLPSDNLVFRLRYNPYKLLNIAFVSPGYAKHRIKELNQLKALFLQQSNLPRIWLDYFVTANPILIKAQLVGGYLEKQLEIPSLDIIDNFISKRNDIDALFLEQLDAYFDQEVRETDPLYRNILSCATLYGDLYLLTKLHCTAHSEDPDFLSPFLSIICTEELCDACSHSSELLHLLGDAVLQVTSIMCDEERQKAPNFPDTYLQQFMPNDKWHSLLSHTGLSSILQCKPNPDFYETALRRYTNETTYVPVSLRSDCTPQFDAFTDLGFIAYLYRQSF